MAGMLGTRLATRRPLVPPVIRCPIKAPRPNRPGKQSQMEGITHTHTHAHKHFMGHCRSYHPAPPSVYATPTQSASGSSYGAGYGAPPRSPKITTTYANDSCEDCTSSTPSSYYQTPTSGSMDDSSSSLLSGHGHGHGHRSPKSPCKFVFDAVSPSGATGMLDQAALGKKFEYYEPISPDDGSLYYEPPSSPRRQGSGKKLMRSQQQQQQAQPVQPVLEQLPSMGMGVGKRRRDEWELPVITKLDARSLNAAAATGVAAGSYYGLKRDSCVTECTQLSIDSGETQTQHTTTTTTSFSYTDTDAGQGTTFHEPSPSPSTLQRQQRRHAINITSNPGYQVLHSSHSTLDRTCSDSVVSLRYRKSTSDLTKDSEHELSGCKPMKPKRDAVEYKPRRRGSSKGGLAYLASRRSSRESMKSACSNASIFSNDDIGPLAFQSSNRGRQRRTSNFLELPGG